MSVTKMLCISCQGFVSESCTHFLGKSPKDYKHPKTRLFSHKCGICDL